MLLAERPDLPGFEDLDRVALERLGDLRLQLAGALHHHDLDAGFAVRGLAEERPAHTFELHERRSVRLLHLLDGPHGESPFRGYRVRRHCDFVWPSPIALATASVEQHDEDHSSPRASTRWLFMFSAQR